MSLRALVPPFEILDLPDMGKISLRIVSWEQGTMTIRPRYPGAPDSKEIQVLRVHLAPGVKAYPPMYYDITSSTLIAQLMPHLAERGFQYYEYVITKYGVAPKARFTLEVVALA